MLASAPRQGLALAATALAAVALAIGVGGRGCGAEDDSPEGAVRAFAAAARAGDRETMLALLGPATRQRLEDAARRHGQMVPAAPGQPRRAAIDMLGADPSSAPARIAVREQQGGRAVADLVDGHGQRSSVVLVQVDGRWRIELPAAEAGR